MIDEGAASRLRRHDLLHIAPGAWEEALRSRSDLAGIELLDGWADAGWPVIVRRRDDGDQEGTIPVAVPLPRAARRTGVALALPPVAVSGRRAPMSLEDVRAVTPRAWHESIDALVAAGARHRSRPIAFGSVLWQALTGLSYVGATSDLDLAWPVDPTTDITSLVELLRDLDRNATPRIDGELIFPDGGAVSWRELARGPRLVIVKRVDRIESCPIEMVLGPRAS